MQLFSIRLDWELDNSTKQTIREVNFETPNASDIQMLNGYKYTNSAFVARKTTLEKEEQAQRDACTATGRFWRVESADKTNAMGHACAYKIIASGATMPIASEEASFRKRSPFVEHTFHGIQYSDDDGRKAPSGPFPAQSTHEQGGLTTWRKGNHEITDPVTFVTIGLNHLTQARSCRHNAARKVRHMSSTERACV
jgi:primary-amine oxidase